MTLEKEIDDHNHKVSRESGLHPKVHVFQRKYHPMTIYGDLIEIGLNTKQAKVMSTYYENTFYNLFRQIYTKDLDKFQARIKSGG